MATNDLLFSSDKDGTGLTHSDLDKVGLDTSTPRFPRTRRRRLPHGLGNFGYNTDTYHSINIDQLISSNTTNYINRSDYVHLCSDTIPNPNYDFVKFGRPADNGGPLTTYKIEWYRDTPFRFDFRKPAYKHYYGMAHVVPSAFADAGITVWSSLVPPQEDLTVSALGASLWASLKPAKPTVDIGVFIGELRDLPKLLHATLDGIKTIGDVYLAAQFGWKPLLTDILDMLRFMDRVERQIDFILNNAGKPVWCATKPQETTTCSVLQDIRGTATQWLAPNIGPKFFGTTDNARNQNILTRDLVQRTWATGLFVFWFDKGRIPERAELRAKLAGLELTPKLVWELLPWTWIIDWFSNIDDILSNLVVEVADNQVSIYAYAMKETLRTYTWWATDGFGTGTVSRRFHTKIRDKISPFGLATYNTTLSDKQTAILAALSVQKL
jgi:hypothetical protein